MSAGTAERLIREFRDLHKSDPAYLRKPLSADVVYKMFSDTAEAVAHLTARVKALEDREYKGVHEEGRGYTRGQFVTKGGAMWHCNRTTRQRPGETSDWTLAVKAGRDGKDARS